MNDIEKERQAYAAEIRLYRIRIEELEKDNENLKKDNENLKKEAVFHMKASVEAERKLAGLAGMVAEMFQHVVPVFKQSLHIGNELIGKEVHRNERNSA